MSYAGEKFFIEKEIRDTLEKVSQMTYAGAFIPKTILFRNTLDQPVSVDVFGCSKEDSSVHYKINASPIIVPSGENTFETLDDYFQCFFLHAQCSVAPTSGAFWSEMLMTSGNGN